MPTYGRDEKHTEDIDVEELYHLDQYLVASTCANVLTVINAYQTRPVL